MLTLVEYLLLLYRALLPTPVWYRFFLNKEYGSLFSSLMTGLYLTFKLTSVVEKVWFFLECAFNVLKCFFNFSLNFFLFLYVYILFLGSCDSGPIILCCSKGIVAQRDPLWGSCNFRTGTASASSQTLSSMLSWKIDVKFSGVYMRNECLGVKNMSNFIVVSLNSRLGLDMMFTSTLVQLSTDPSAQA